MFALDSGFITVFFRKYVLNGYGESGRLARRDSFTAHPATFPRDSSFSVEEIERQDCENYN
jgi:hypothetical protein